MPGITFDHAKACKN